MKQFWACYGKAIMGVVTALVVTAVAITSGDGSVSTEEWFQLLTEFAAALGIWMVPAFPGYPWVKTAQGALMAAIVVGGTVLLDGVSTNDILMIVVAVLGAVSVAAAPAKVSAPV